MIVRMSEEAPEWVTWELECGHETAGRADAERLYCAECIEMHQPGGGSRAVTHEKEAPAKGSRGGETGEISGEVVQAPPAADMRYDGEGTARVARVLVRVEWAGGKIREYEAPGPDRFKINDPETDLTVGPVGITAHGITGGISGRADKPRDMC